MSKMKILIDRVTTVCYCDICGKMMSTEDPPTYYSCYEIKCVRCKKDLCKEHAKFIGHYAWTIATGCGKQNVGLQTCENCYEIVKTNKEKIKKIKKEIGKLRREYREKTGELYGKKNSS